MFKISEDKSTITCSGVLRSAYKLPDKDNPDTKPTKNVITFVPDDNKKVFDSIIAYKDSGKNFTPTWYNKKEYVILRSIYDIPFKTPDNEQVSFERFCERGLIANAEVVVKFVQKEGACYPIAVVVKKDGDLYNPFDDMDE